MAIREIVTVPDPVLRKKAREVTDFGPDLQKLIDDMVDTMREAPGVGLAGPQVNQSIRVIVVEYGEEEEKPPKLFAVVNPEITRASRDTELGTEGCLSIPEIVGNVERAHSVTVKGQNRHGQPIKIKAEGWLARIFQHEVDHLNGVLFVDLAEKLWKLEKENESPLPAD
ncbi:MAG TPA: peptide deformylase [Anaerolineales bacterium]|nr:peptide deformylase [Anaerolineales bacterium]